MYLEEQKSSRKENAVSAQLAIVDKEISVMKEAISENNKMSKNVHAEFLRLSDEAEKKRKCVKKIPIPRKTG